MANYDLTYEGSEVQKILDTGDELQNAGYIFRGEATPSTVPGTPTERVAYIGGPGTYTNFGGSITVGAGCICVFKYTGSAWSNQVINTGLDSAVNTLQSAITAINNNIGNGYVYAGVATPSTSPVTGKVFYLAVQAGTYTNFGNAVVTAGLNVIKYNGSAWSVDQLIAIDAEPTQGSDHLVKSGGVLGSIIQNGPAFDLSAYNAQGGVLATYADLSAALTALNALPADFKKGGMSVKFVQTSDNKYIQARCMADSFTTDVTQWQGIDNEPTAGSENLVKSGGVWDAIKPLLSSSVNDSEYHNFPFVFELGKTYTIKNTSTESTQLLSARARRDNGASIQDVCNDLAVNSEVVYTPSYSDQYSATKIGVKIIGGGSFEVYCNEGIEGRIVKLEKDSVAEKASITELQKKVGEYVSGNIVNSDYHYYEMPIKAGEKYIIRNTSSIKTHTLNAATTNSNNVAVQTICTNLIPGQSQTITASSNQPKIRVQITDGGSFDFYSYDTINERVQNLGYNQDKIVDDIHSIGCNSLKFLSGYAYYNAALITSSSNALYIEFKTGDDVVTRQRLYNGSAAGSDASFIDIVSGKINFNLNTTQTSASFGIGCFANTYYKILVRFDGHIIVNGKEYTIPAGSTIIESAFIIGVRRISGRAIPFVGEVYAVGVIDDASSLTTIYNSKDIRSLCSHYYDAYNYKNSKVYDYVGGATLDTAYLTTATYNISSVMKEINNLSGNCCGVIRSKKVDNPAYSEKFGDLNIVLSHFRLALVKDGVVQYYLKQDDINKKENGTTNSKLDGTDGDVLVVNDAPIYYLIYGTEDYDIKIFGLEPFIFRGIPSETLRPKGVCPSLAFVVKDEGSELSSFVRNVNKVGDAWEMKGLVGSYVPSENGGVISYSYDSSVGFMDSGVYRPSCAMSQNTAEKAAINKHSVHSYTNIDLLSKEILISLIQAECGTSFFNSLDLFGYGFMGVGTTEITESDFTNGTAAKSAVRFKDANNNWVYSSVNEEVFENVNNPITAGSALFCMLTGWRSPWEIMEQHMVLSYAKTNNIAENTWFVYNNKEYKYRSVSGCKGLSNGVMTAVLWRKFRTKIADGVTYNNTDVSGNDIEYIITSAVYRGWVIDMTNHVWLTGINCVLSGDNPQRYYFFTCRDYKKYLMNKDYSVIASNEKFDFESVYELTSDVNWPSNGYPSIYSNTSLLVPKNNSYYTTPGSGSAYMKLQTDSVQAEQGSKKVTGVKNGYGAYSVLSPSGFLYISHSRSYNEALAGYSSFICQDLQTI